MNSGLENKLAVIIGTSHFSRNTGDEIRSFSAVIHQPSTRSERVFVKLIFPNDFIHFTVFLDPMGKSFKRELEAIPQTIQWANSLDVCKLSDEINRFKNPVYIVGSGGSYSACVYAADLLVDKGFFARALTPLELFNSQSTIGKANLIFISASGGNTDILFAFKKAVVNEPISIITICMGKQTKLTQLSSKYSSCSNYEFEPPSGKDGFLATNTLITYFIILYKVISGKPFNPEWGDYSDTINNDFTKEISGDTCFTILYGNHHHAVAVDIESKLSEAGLAPSLICDYRQFAHGRHNWFDKKPDSAIIALTCPSDEKLCKKTLSLLPEHIPKAVFETPLSGFAGTVSLLIQAMKFVSSYGISQGVDPGRPGVPEYGSRIYHLRYEKLIADSAVRMDEIAIKRKNRVNRFSDLLKKEQDDWKVHYQKFVDKMMSGKFGCLIFDYDGTLCSSANREDGLCPNLHKLLLNFVQKGFILGVVSGRGKSVRIAMEKVFLNDPLLMSRVVMGYYNGSDIASLTNSQHPIKPREMNPSLQILNNKLHSIGIEPDESPEQLMFKATSTDKWMVLKDTLLNELMLLDLPDLTIVESTHSLDIIPRSVASKNNILKHCQDLCLASNLSSEALCIGDKGQWPGNDFALLANKYSLSVGEVSSSPDTGWNICPPGLRDEKAVEYLFGKFQFKSNYFTLTNI